MAKVKAKKYLGQHFLRDTNIAYNIVDSLQIDKMKQIIAQRNGDSNNIPCLEIGPGMGVLTQFLLKKKELDFYAVELDTESVKYLNKQYTGIEDKIIQHDFLKLDLHQYFKKPLVIIGNFPYNISSQIMFRTLEHKDLVVQVVGMFQKEVAERLAAKPGSKTYGILSVLLKAFFDVEYLFTVDEHVFDPPPKVKSAVIRLTRNNVEKLDCNDKFFVKVVKATFNQRRKKIKNSLKKLLNPDFFNETHNENLTNLLSNRPEQLSLQQFVELTNLLEENEKLRIKN